MRGNSLVFALTCSLGLFVFPSVAQSQLSSDGLNTVLSPQPESTGGPDAFGYQFIDSDEVDGPVFSFLDISDTGTPFDLDDDNEAGPLAIGFGFDFYGATYTEVFIESNGFLSFEGGAGEVFENDCPLVPGSSPGKIIAPYWDDLIALNPDASVYLQNFSICPEVPAGSGATACTVVQWDQYDFYNEIPEGVRGEGGISFLGTFQAILYDDGQILFQYDSDFVGNGDGATIAISQDGDTNSLLYSCDTFEAVGAQKAVLFFATQPTLAIDCPAGCPGTCTVELGGMTPLGSTVLMRSPALGSPGDVIGGGPCSGLELDLASPVKRVVRRAADMDGNLTLGPRFFNLGLCMDSWQALDRTTCQLSNVDSATSVRR